MTDREQKIKKLLEGFYSLRRHMTFRPKGLVAASRITPSQWRVLMCIEQRGESTVKDVAKALDMTSSAATQLVDGLVASGYVLRRIHTKDRRAVVLTLSAKTKTHVEKMKKQAVQEFLKFFAVLDDKEFNQYFALNQKIVQGSISKKHT